MNNAFFKNLSAPEKKRHLASLEKPTTNKRVSDSDSVFAVNYEALQSFFKRPMQQKEALRAATRRKSLTIIQEESIVLTGKFDRRLSM